MPSDAEGEADQPRSFSRRLRAAPQRYAPSAGAHKHAPVGWRRLKPRTQVESALPEECLEGLEQKDFDLPEDWVERVRCGPPPPKYRLLIKNCYRDSSLRPYVDKETAIAHCSCTPDTGCDHNCMNKQLFMECVVGECPTLRGGEKHCDNMVIQRRNFPPTEVFHTESRGWGLRTKEAVPANTPLIEYLGEVTTMDEIEVRLESMTAEHDFYFAALYEGLVLDAGPMGSEARFANHSCAPNTTMQKWTVQGEPHIMLVSLRDLAKGEEITYNYQLDDCEGLFGRQVCKCGSLNCSGFIGKRPKGSGLPPSEDWLLRAEQQLAMKLPTLEALEALVEEAPETNNCEAFIELQQRVTVANNWIRAYHRLFKGWFKDDSDGEESSDEEEEGEGDEEMKVDQGDTEGQAGEEATSQDGERASKGKEEEEEEEGPGEGPGQGEGECRDGEDRSEDAMETETESKATEPTTTTTTTTTTRNNKGGSSSGSVSLVGGSNSKEFRRPPLVKYDELCALMSHMPANLRFPEASEAKQLWNKARAAQQAVTRLLPEMFKDLAPPSTSLTPTTATTAQAEGASGTTGPTGAEGSETDAPMEDGQEAPVAAEGASGPKEEGDMDVDGEQQDKGAQEPTVQERVQMGGGACVVGGVIEEKEGSEANGEGPLADNARGPEPRPTAPSSASPPVAKEYIPGGVAMRAVCVALRDGLDCVPVAISGLEHLVEPLLMVEAWAKRACQGLKIKIPSQNEREAEERRNPRRRRRENDPHTLLQEYVEWYVGDGQQEAPRQEGQEGQEGLAGGFDFYSLDALEEGLEDTVNIIVAREDGREYSARKAREEAAKRDEEEKERAAAAKAYEVRRGERNKARRESAGEGKKGRGRGKKRDDDEEEEEDKALYCVCQLPEGESNSRTMVNCDDCKDWFHPNCVHMNVKSLKSHELFHCPVCRHARGLPSELACPAPPRVSLRPGPRPTLHDLNTAWEELNQLPIGEMDVVPFLGCLKDTADRWVVRVEALLHPPSPSPSLSDEGESPEVSASASASEASADLAPASTCPEEAALLVRQAWRVEAEKVQEAARLVAEHRLLDLSIDHAKVHDLRLGLWTTIAPLALATPRHAQLLARPALTLEALVGMIDEGHRLGQKRSPHLQRLTKARDAAWAWLAKAVREKPFTCLVTKIPRPPHVEGLDMGGEWGYARYTAAVLYRQRLALSKQLQQQLKQEQQKQQQQQQQQAQQHTAVVVVVNGSEAPVVEKEEEKEEKEEGQAETQSEAEGEAVVEVEAFCLCRGGEVGQMVNCEGCGEWYHFDCVGYKPPPRPKKGEPKPKGEGAYTCIICAESRHKRYKFQWASSVTGKRGLGAKGGPAAKKRKAGKGAAKGKAKKEEAQEESDLDDMDMQTGQ